MTEIVAKLDLLQQNSSGDATPALQEIQKHGSPHFEFKRTLKVSQMFTLLSQTQISSCENHACLLF